MKKNYLLFIGSGRTGSTLVGFLINKHPEAAVTIESRMLDKAFDTNTPIKKYLKQLKKISNKEYMIQQKYVDKINENSSWDEWQSDWIYPNEKSYLKKRKNIKIFGDKKQGGTTRLLLKDEIKVFELLNDLNIYFISCIRHPYSVVDSYSRLGLLSDKIMSDYIKYSLKGLSLINEKRGHIVFYENLLSNPESELYNLFNYLNLNVDKEFINTLLPLINTDKIVKPPKISNDLKKKLEIELPQVLSLYEENLYIN